MVFAADVEAVRPQVVLPKAALLMVAVAVRSDAERRDVLQPVEPGQGDWLGVAALRIVSHHPQAPLAVDVASVWLCYHRHQPQELVWSEECLRFLIARRQRIGTMSMPPHPTRLHSGRHWSVSVLQRQQPPRKNPARPLVHQGHL